MTERVQCTGACLSRGCNCVRPDPIPTDRVISREPVVGRITFCERVGGCEFDACAANGRCADEAVTVGIPERYEAAARSLPYADANVQTMVHIVVERRANGETVFHKGYAFQVSADKECEKRQIQSDTVSALHGHVPSRFFVVPLTVEPDNEA